MKINCVTPQAIVFETPPQTRTIISCNLWNKDARYFYLEFPYILFLLLCENNEVKHFDYRFVQKPLTNPNDNVYLPMLHEACWGNIKERPKAEGGAELLVNAFLNMFWQTGFSHDISKHIYQGFSFELWHELTETHPGFTLREELAVDFYWKGKFGKGGSFASWLNDATGEENAIYLS